MALNVFLTGGNGILGKEMIKISNQYNIEFKYFSSDECDITHYEQIEEKISNFEGNIVLHAAAITDIKKIQNNPMLGIDINVLGTTNLVKICDTYKKKLIYISTDHVFDGEKGFYVPEDPINPISTYAKSKAAAELVVRMVKSNLVIRTSFCKKEFPYEKALCDQWTSKDYVDIIAPLIMNKLLSDTTGVIHVGTERKNLFNLAMRRKIDIKKTYIKEVDHVCKIGKDYSFKEIKK
ncbi:MAG: SDR family oxidoreductase [Promethearchaeota archaeon]|jgi:dTDP-4-dehydrorhamnose reductase